MNESPKMILERFFVLLLTREKITLGKFQTLETLKVRENPLLAKWVRFAPGVSS
jgi:hypothetical protein